MSEIKSFFLGIVLGGCFAAGTIYYFALGPSNDRVGQLRAELTTAKSVNTELIQSADRRQRTLNEARSVITSSISSVNKLREIIKLLQDDYERTNNSSGY